MHNTKLISLVLSLLLCGIHIKSTSQVFILGGTNYSTVLENNILTDKAPILTYHLGAGYKYSPVKNSSKFSLQHELLYNEGGYKINLGTSQIFKFHYLEINNIAAFAIHEKISIITGIGFKMLLYTNVYNGKQTYNNTDINVMGGVSFFEKSLISGYIRCAYGLLPMLDYYEFDELGNFTNSFKDFHNFSSSIGIKVNLSK